jgi:hypothetical protein
MLSFVSYNQSFTSWTSSIEWRTFTFLSFNHLLLFMRATATTSIFSTGATFVIICYFSTNPEAEENVAMRSFWEVLDGNPEDEYVVEEAADVCFFIILPFMKNDFLLRRQSIANTIPTNESIKLQVKTRDGILQATTHTQHIKYPRDAPIPNIYPSLPFFPASSIEIQSEIVCDIFKIKIDNSIYCMKSVHRGHGEEALKRELSILPHCSHPNIIRFIGLGESTTEEDKVEVMVIEYIDNAKSLEDVDCITRAQCERWTREIRSAIEYLQGKGFVWGDAKAGNILIHESGRVLLDFGGGFPVDGWNCKFLRP